MNTATLRLDITFRLLATARAVPVYAILANGVDTKLRTCDPAGFLAGTEPDWDDTLPARPGYDGVTQPLLVPIYL